MKLAALLPLFAIAFLLGGCMDITGRGPAPLEHTIDAHARATHERVGYVYCMRGWLGIFSTGMDALAEKIDSNTGVGAPAVSVADEEWLKLQAWLIEKHKAGQLNDGPLVLLGHSWGADDQIRVAMQLQKANIPVELLVLIDPVTPPPVPTNVKRVYCVYKSHPLTDWYPAWRGVPATVEDPKLTPLVNINLRTDKVDFDTEVVDHVNIEKIEGVHKMVMDQIKLTCPTRAAWNQGRSAPLAQPASAGTPLSARPVQPRPAVATP